MFNHSQSPTASVEFRALAIKWDVAMSWESALQQLDTVGTVEFGIHQMNEKTGTPKWRRHKGGPNFRFHSVRSALFSPDKGARAACLGNSSYATHQYSMVDKSVVPYVASWVKSASIAFLARASASDPEVTLVPVSALETLSSTSHEQLLTELAEIFGNGAEIYGVRHLVSGEIKTP